MTKTELIATLATKADITKTAASKVLDALAEVATEELSAGEELLIPGIGKLSVTIRAARKGRNPKTGEEIDIPPGRAVKFKVLSALKNAVAE